MKEYSWLNISINFICKLIWCCFGLWSITYALVIIYDVNINNINIILYGFIAMIAFIFLVQSYKTSAVGIILLFSLFYKLSVEFSGFFPKIIIGFRIIGAEFIKKLQDIGYIIEYDFGINNLPIKLNEHIINSYSQTAILSLMIFMSVVLALYAYKKHHPFFVSFISILLMLPGIIYEFMPSILVFRLILSFLIGLFVMKLFDKIYNRAENTKFLKKESIKQSFSRTIYCGKYTLVVFIISYVVSIFSGYIPESVKLVNVSLFEKIAKEISVSAEKNISTIRKMFDIRFKGSIVNGNLGRGGFKYYNFPVMDVYSSSTMPIYLRRWVGKDYSLNKWNSFSENDMNEYLIKFGDDFMPEQITWNFFKSLSNMPYFTEIIDNSISLIDVHTEYVDINRNLLYIPSVAIDVQNYFTKSDFKNKGEGMVSIDNKFDVKAGYSLKAIMPIYSYEHIGDLITYGEKSSDTGENNIALEQKYRQFVYSNYTYLPADLYGLISNLSTDITVDATNSFEKVILIQNYLSQNYTYNLNPPPIPDNTDFVEYFLFDSKEGYCTYYATAMVLMLRSIGIPARYVEGYLVQGEGTKLEEVYKRTVLDSDAHAWPEVYFDGVGWLPFEPTVTFTSELFAQKDEFENTNSNFSEYEETLQAEQKVIEEEAQQAATVSAQQVEELKLSTEQNNILKKFNIYIIIAIIFIPVLFVVYRIIKNKRGKPHTVEQIIKYIFEQLEYMKIIRHQGELPTDFALRVDQKISDITTIHFANITEIILKARFSKLDITPNEFNVLKKYALAVSKASYEKANVFKKLWLLLFYYIGT